MQVLVKGSRLLMLAFCAIIIVGVLIPVTIPLGATSYIKDMFNAIDALPAGSLVYGYVDASGYDYYSALAVMEVLIYQVRVKHFKMIVAGGWGAKVNVHDRLMCQAYGVNNLKDYPGYGTEVLDLGLIPAGWATTIFSMKDDWSIVTKVDMYGTPLEELPLYHEFKGMRDADLAWGAGDSFPVYYAALDVKCPAKPQGHTVFVLVRGDAADVARYINEYYYAGMVYGGIAGAKQAAQYAYLLGFQGSMAYKLLFAEVLVTIFIFGGMIAVNAQYLLTRRKEPVK